MDRKEFSFLIADEPSRENVYLEIWWKNEMIAEITNERRELKVIFYFDSKPIEFNYEVLLEVLEDGKNWLLGNHPK